MDELLIFCLWYLKNIPTLHNRLPISIDDSRGAVHTIKLDDKTLR
jgi:hypothetical protein